MAQDAVNAWLAQVLARNAEEVQPPRERPRAWVPFLARASVLGMHLHDREVQKPFLWQLGEDPVQHSLPGPALHANDFRRSEFADLFDRVDLKRQVLLTNGGVCDNLGVHSETSGSVCIGCV